MNNFKTRLDVQNYIVATERFRSNTRSGDKMGCSEETRIAKIRENWQSSARAKIKSSGQLVNTNAFALAVALQRAIYCIRKNCEFTFLNAHPYWLHKNPYTSNQPCYLNFHILINGTIQFVIVEHASCMGLLHGNHDRNASATCVNSPLQLVCFLSCLITLLCSVAQMTSLIAGRKARVVTYGLSEPSSRFIQTIQNRPK